MITSVGEVRQIKAIVEEVKILSLSRALSTEIQSRVS